LSLDRYFGDCGGKDGFLVWGIIIAGLGVYRESLLLRRMRDGKGLGGVVAKSLGMMGFLERWSCGGKIFILLKVYGDWGGEGVIAAYDSIDQSESRKVWEDLGSDTVASKFCCLGSYLIIVDYELWGLFSYDYRMEFILLGFRDTESSKKSRSGLRQENDYSFAWFEIHSLCLSVFDKLCENCTVSTPYNIISRLEMRRTNIRGSLKGEVLQSATHFSKSWISR
jgi:hypothetical protein